MGADTSGRGVIRRAVAGQRRDVVVGSLLGAAHQTGEALVPVLIGLIVDRAVVRPDGGALAAWLVVLAVVYAMLSYGFRFGARAGERAAEQAAHQLRLDVVRRVLAPHGGAEAGRPPGALVNVATEDARRVGALNMALTLGIAAVVGVVAGAVLLLRASVPLGLLVLIGAPVLMALGHYLARPLEHRSEAEQERAAHASGVAADLVAGVRVLKGLRAERAAVARYRTTSQASREANVRAARAAALQTGLMLTLTGAFIALVALVGGRLVLSGSIGLGALVSAVGLALFLPGPISVLAWVGAELARARASAARIADVLAAPGETTGGTAEPAAPATGELRLHGLGHAGLDGIDLTVRPGEHLGIVVTDTADAATLLHCLARRCDPDRGRIELDGTPVTELAPAALRSALLVAEHDAQLFDGTLLDNVTAAAPAGADPRPAMDAAAVDEVAATLPGGTSGRIGERGSSLSGGQRQRVALARALAADRSVLVVHDPTTAVDAATEARIATGIRRARTGRTTVLVTSSPALLAATDRVVLIDGGTITAEAPHEDLVRDHPVYRTAVLT
ncbi:ABC transporter ATP-binding protein [Streptomyces microflavus]|uniref:ABC transporter ATP-binding protein n=1 Tax=Streptomyces TaxID=1883 RepID=UPI0005178C2F|nr:MULTISPECIES: ABC transporter ATP-binding protein [Streptomyces]MDX2979017.1 ABC transporter ATP-binding protein [Streptomyces sp. NRRL_B-2249]WSA64078.1 ABC transporter ATP-binding protein/permease [Streptomyces microflavus]WSS33245.1 ABC transporter ATP-binding protein/permease [Streptomyces microflavus]WST18222.1 ABC transporter ATP-binding protein/permease [Streptomyces microflavus]SCK36223.1 putative ABC transport system ATP-binding protein [Streptomyces sp. ScaeMP-e48]